MNDDERVGGSVMLYLNTNPHSITPQSTVVVIFIAVAYSPITVAVSLSGHGQTGRAMNSFSTKTNTTK